MLNHAAANTLTRTTRLAGLIAAAAMLASPALALDGIDLSSPAEPTAPGECPRLVQIKYPFLSCPNGQIGQSDADENWDNSRRLPMQSDWNEGDAYWGPSPNAD